MAIYSKLSICVNKCVILHLCHLACTLIHCDYTLRDGRTSQVVLEDLRECIGSDERFEVRGCWYVFGYLMRIASEAIWVSTVMGWYEYLGRLKTTCAALWSCMYLWPHQHLTPSPSGTLIPFWQWGGPAYWVHASGPVLFWQPVGPQLSHLTGQANNWAELRIATGSLLQVAEFVCFINLKAQDYPRKSFGSVTPFTSYFEPQHFVSQPQHNHSWYTARV